MYYTRDTLIMGKTYNVVEPSYGYFNQYYQSFTRYSNDSVYRWINEAEYLYYHFQMHLGDYITTYRSIAGTNDTSCSSLIVLEVIDSEVVNISGVNLTKWTLKDTVGFDPLSSGSPYYPEYHVIEEIGIEEYLGFYYPGEGIDCSVETIESYAILDGYNSDIFTEWVADCPMADLKDETQYNFSIYPNPCKDRIFIVSDINQFTAVDLELMVLDLCGREVFRQALPAQPDYEIQLPDIHRDSIFFA